VDEVGPFRSNNQREPPPLRIEKGGAKAGQWFPQAASPSRDSSMRECGKPETMRAEGICPEIRKGGGT